MKKIIIIPPAENADPKLIDCLYEKYKYTTHIFSVEKKNDKNTLDINLVIHTGNHSNYIKMVVASNHFEIAKKIANKFCVHTNNTNCLILTEENKKSQMEKIINFLDDDKYTLCFLVGFEKKIYTEFDWDIYEFYLEKLQSV